MTDVQGQVPLVILIVGSTIVAAVFVKVGLERLRIPVLIGYIGLGALIRLADSHLGFLQDQGRELFHVLERIGVICMLFRVGLESKLGGLMRQLRRATHVWLISIAVCGVFGYGACALVLGLPHIPSLFVGVALTATSVGMGLSEWWQRGLLTSRDGQLLVDVVEMDDVSAVVLMGVVLGLAPYLREGSDGADLLPIILRVSAGELFKLLTFATVCIVFARYAERPITGFIARHTAVPNLLLLVLGSGFILAAIAGVLGLSVAIGAFFAGLVFSRDPEAVKVDAAFGTVYDLFVPFLFIGIGLNLTAPSLAQAQVMGLVLFAAAVAGKVVGVAAPALTTSDGRTAVLLGVSMIPRAEIALLIMEQGHALGAWAVPDDVLSAMVLACIGTWFVTPFVLRRLFARWGPPAADSA